MHSLKFDSFEFPITDFVLLEDIIALDANCATKESFDKLSKLAFTHNTIGSIYEYQLDEVAYCGHFGNFISDTNHNVRFYMTTTPNNTNAPSFYTNVLEYNIPRILHHQEKQISALVDLLVNKGILASTEAVMFAPYLPINETHDVNINWWTQVKCLSSYLTETKQTLNDLRQRN
ncbi:hypothetical protein D3Z53_21935 [Lachnospiraceae bacterium]|jgi:hypothetical protein|nr:hypothetical protein [uncultured Schaedlerella sp.]NBI60633.1 hypothetical protein [Lachnospiraceae bacterium]